MTTPLKVNLVDISHHNPTDPDMGTAASAGVEGVYHKATEGATVRDDKYNARRAIAASARMPFGGYSFASPDGPSDGVTEAAFFLTVAQPKFGDLLPMHDFEDEGALRSVEDKQRFARGFSHTIKRAVGAHPILYCPWDLGLPYIKMVPRYNDTNTPPVIPTDIWQFSNGVLGVPDSVAGFGHVDLSTFRRVTLADLLIPHPEARYEHTTVVSHNMGNKPDATADDLDALWKLGAAAYGLQEGRDRAKQIAAWVAAHPRAAMVPFVGDGVADTPILYRTDRLTLHSFFAIKVAGPTNVGDGKAHSGAGPDTINPKSICVAKFYDRLTRRWLWVINFHQIASWTRTAAYLGTEEWRDRRAYGSHLIELVTGAVDKIDKGNIFTTCDANADSDFPLMAPLHNAVDLGDTEPTHKNSRFDFVGVDEHPSLRTVDRRVLEVTTSDHRTVVADAQVLIRAA